MTIKGKTRRRDEWIVLLFIFRVLTLSAGASNSAPLDLTVSPLGLTVVSSGNFFKVGSLTGHRSKNPATVNFGGHRVKQTHLSKTRGRNRFAARRGRLTQR